MPDNYVRLGGLPYRATPEQAQEAVQAGGSVISKPEAESGTRAREDLSYVDQNWGSAGKFGMGLLSGATLGLGPGMLTTTGDIDPRHLQAAQESGLYTAGDIAGLVAPSVLGGELLGAGRFFTPAGILDGIGTGTERLVGGVLGESTGVLGNLGRNAAMMAARGSAEGAAINLGHTVGQGLIQNEPLSAEALLASSADGALFGGLIGGGLGTLGSLSAKAVESAEGGIKRLATKAGGPEGGQVYKRLGLSTEDASYIRENGGLNTVDEILKRSGTDVKISNTEEKIGSALKTSRENFQADRAEPIRELDKLAPQSAPDIERIQARIRDEALRPRMGTSFQDSTVKIVRKFNDDLDTLSGKYTIPGETIPGDKIPAKYRETFNPTAGIGSKYKQELVSPASKEPDFQGPDITFAGEKPSWENLIKSRDQLAKDVANATGGSLKNDIRKEVLNVMDSEIRSAMESASTTPGLEGVADKYAAATTRLKIAEKMEQSIGKKSANKLLTTEPLLTPGDVAFGGLVATANPVHAGIWLGGKIAQKKIQRAMEPAMAQMAMDMAVGSKAAQATQSLKAQTRESMSKFFSSASKTPAKGGYSANAKEYNAPKREKVDRAMYEAAADRTEQLTTREHQMRIQRYMENLNAMGYSGLADALMSTNNRATQYLLWNLPARQGAKAVSSLRQMPVSKVPTLQEYKFFRIDQAIKKGPVSLLEDLESGNLSTDAVRAVKYVYPEAHSQIVEEAANQIYTAKTEGKYLPVSKIALLGTALDAPIDSILQSDYIQGVQMALNMPPGPQNPNPPPATQSPTGFSPSSEALLTPAQKVMQA